GEAADAEEGAAGDAGAVAGEAGEEVEHGGTRVRRQAGWARTAEGREAGSGGGTRRRSGDPSHKFAGFPAPVNRKTRRRGHTPAVGFKLQRMRNRLEHGEIWQTRGGAPRLGRSRPCRACYRSYPAAKPPHSSRPRSGGPGP